MPPSSANAGTTSQVVVDVGERRLQPERDEDDAGDHREVEVRVGVARQLVLLPAGVALREPPRR